MSFNPFSQKRKNKKKEKEAEQTAYAKTVFLVVLAMLVITTSMFVRERQKPQPLDAKPTTAPARQLGGPARNNSTINSGELEQVLGEQFSTQQDTLGVGLEKSKKIVEKQAPAIKKQIEGEADRLVEEGKDELQNTVSKFLYSTASKPVINYIKALPNEQKQSIVNQLCTDKDLLRE